MQLWPSSVTLARWFLSTATSPRERTQVKGWTPAGFWVAGPLLSHLLSTDHGPLVTQSREKRL